MSDVVEVLKAARAIIERRENWLQGIYALNANGDATDPRSRDAVCFCATGAVMKVINSVDCGHHKAMLALDDAVPASYETLAAYNDYSKRTHSQVLRVFDRAIAAAEAQP